MANKAMWDWMDKAEGKEVGSSHANMEKERERQGYKKSKSKSQALANKKKEVAGKMKGTKHLKVHPVHYGETKEE